ncbi:MAG: nucleoside-diphosphate kinase [Anaerolineaceae bacterium]|nr:nucleoside-diphosphate kinase [Anaerolineaceae bacterium]
MQRTLVLIKPDAVQRSLIGKITTRLEQRGYKLIALKALMVSEEKAAVHYADLQEKPFYEELIRFMISSPVIAMVWEGHNAILSIRKTMGSTRPDEAEPGSIRHDYASNVAGNLTHASDSVENAEEEIPHWFSDDELMVWDRSIENWVTEDN